MAAENPSVPFATEIVNYIVFFNEDIQAKYYVDLINVWYPTIKLDIYVLEFGYR